MPQSNAQRKEDESTDAQPEESRGGRQPFDKFNDGPVQVSIFQNPSSKVNVRGNTRLTD
jgi:hypothetical protein